MSGKHPLDDLFSRGLRDAEAAPPAAVWEGIVRKRGAGHRIGLFLRKRWGLSLLLLLLLGAGTTYAVQLARHDSAAGIAATPSGATTTSVTQDARTAQNDAPAKGIAPTYTTTPASPASLAAPGAPSVGPSDKAAGSNGAGQATGMDDRSVGDVRSSPSAGSASRNTHTSTVANVEPSKAREVYAAADRSTTDTDRSGPQPKGATEAPSRYIAPTGVLDPSSDYFTTAMAGRTIGMDRTALSGDPQRAINTARYAPPKGTWWFGVLGGAYTEDRAWKGGDPELRAALERTEMPHYPWSVGVTGGHLWPSGFHLSTGVEWIRSRYDFRHDDRIVTENMEVNTFIVTLDANVVMEQSDTITTTSETMVHQQALNRFSTLRIPVEAGWRKTWRRWHYGLRAGVAVDHITQNGGYTLQRVAPDVPDATGIRSVDAVSGQRTTTLLSGLVGFDLGFSLSERFALGITPCYSKGLARISAAPDPYTVPERIGVRVGLTYHIPHD